MVPFDDNYVLTVLITSGQIKYLESAAKIKKAPDSGGLSTWDPARLLTSIRIWVKLFPGLLPPGLPQLSKGNSDHLRVELTNAQFTPERGSSPHLLHVCTWSCSVVSDFQTPGLCM